MNEWMDECMIALPAFCAGQRDGCRLKVFKYDQLCRVNFCGLRQVFAGKDQRWSKRLRFDPKFLRPLAAVAIYGFLAPILQTGRELIPAKQGHAS